MMMRFIAIASIVSVSWTNSEAAPRSKVTPRKPQPTVTSAPEPRVTPEPIPTELPEPLPSPSPVITRAEKRIGVSAGFLSQPFPSIFTLQGSYNVLPFIRGSLSAGTFFLGNSVGCGIQYPMLFEMPFSPLFGLHVTKTHVSNPLDWFLDEEALKRTGEYGKDFEIFSVSAQLGMEWQHPEGFNLGGGFNWAFWTNKTGTLDLFVLPYFTVGWFF